MSCENCNDTGYCLDQGYGYADIPDGWVPVQACDNCGLGTLRSDKVAAHAAAANYMVTAEFFEPDPIVVNGEFEDAGPGDWAIPFPTNLTRFTIEYRVTELRMATVWAESESAARQCWIDDCFDSETVEDTEHHLERVYEG